MQKLGLIGKQLTEILNLVGYSSDVGKEVLEMLRKISKLTPADANAAQERRTIEQMAMKNTQQNQQMQAMKQQGQQPGAAGAGGQPGGGMPQPPSAPSMPKMGMAA